MGDEIIRHSSDPMMNEPDGIIPLSDDTVKVLRIQRNDSTTNHHFGEMLAATVQLFNAADIIGKIQKGAEFVVQVPAQYQAELQAGALEMMHGAKSGKTWATIVRKLADGKQEIVCNCPITEQMRVQGNPVQSLSGTYQNLFLQQKLAELSEQVKDVYEAVLNVEQGQTDDRIGKLLSGRNDVMRALENPDTDERKREMALARDKISEAQGQIGQVLKSRVEKFTPIPKSKFARRMREIASPSTSYMKKRDIEFGKLQDYFEFYLRATQLLAWSYTVVGDTSRGAMVFEQAADHLRSIDYSRIRTLDYIYPAESMSDAFYHQSVPYVQAEKAICLEEAKPYDFVQITVTSDELKEAIENGETI